MKMLWLIHSKSQPQGDFTQDWLENSIKASKGFIAAATNTNNFKLQGLCDTRDTFIETSCDQTNCMENKEYIAKRIAEKRIVFANAAAKEKSVKLIWLKNK